MSVADRNKWNAKYGGPETAPSKPSAVLVQLAPYLPTRGRALDIAGGAGRNAIWLAGRGLDVTIADVSSVGLALARQRATAANVKIQTMELDLEQQPLPAGRFDVVLSNCYLCRHLFPHFPSLLTNDGRLVVIQPTKKNLERNEKPPFDYLFEEGELRKLAAGVEILHYEEGWLADDRHDAVLVAKKRPASVV
jgi:ubiquinone/menaquinone biosynthesis C-methylase UbiE